MAWRLRILDFTAQRGVDAHAACLSTSTLSRVPPIIHAHLAVGWTPQIFRLVSRAPKTPEEVKGLILRFSYIAKTHYGASMQGWRVDSIDIDVV